MSEVVVGEEVLLVVKRLMRNFIKKIGRKDEPLIWGFKAHETIQKQAVAAITDCIDHKKIRAVKILHEQVHMEGDKSPQLRSLKKNTIVFIPNADSWNQDTLLRVAFQASGAGSKALIGFSDPSRMSLGIYQFLVTQCVNDDGELFQWAISMSVPIGDIR